jgi:hypothetical protein
LYKIFTIHSFTYPKAPQESAVAGFEMISDSTKRTVGIIRSLCWGELELVLARVRNSEPETVEGRRARERLRAIEAMLRRLANETEETAIIDAVEEIIAVNAAWTPNLDSGGSLN